MKKRAFLIILLCGVLLCNPVVGFVDILPDFLCYLLLCAVFSRLADLNGHIYDAVRRLRVLTLISLAQTAVSYLAYQVILPQATNPYEPRSFLMLGSFLWMLAQICILLPASRDLLLGIEYLAERHGASSLTQSVKGKNAVRHFLGITRIFVILSAVMSFLPEVSALTSLNGAGENGTPIYGIEWYTSAISASPSAVDRYSYIGVLRTLCAMLSFAIAILWMISLIRFLIKVSREQTWLQALDRLYREEVLNTQQAMLTVRRFSVSLHVMQVAILFSASLYVEGREILPSFVFALLTVFSFLYLRGLCPRRTGIFATCLPLAAVGLLHVVLNHLYLKRFTPMDSLYQEEAYLFYRVIQIMECVEALLTWIAVACLFGQLLALLRRHVGADPSKPSYQTAKALKWVRGRMTVALVFFGLSAISVVARSFLQFAYPNLWWLSILLFVISIGLFYSVTYEVKSQLVFQYGTDGVNKNI